MTETALVQATLRGDMEAFGTLACRYQQSLVASARHLTGSVEDAEDLAQEALVRAYQSLRSLQDPEKFRAWLFTILRHLCLNHLQRQPDVSLSLRRHHRFAGCPGNAGGRRYLLVARSSAADLP